MSDPYRTSAMVFPVPVSGSADLEGVIMSRWTLGPLSLEWTHSDDSMPITLGVAGSGTSRTQVVLGPDEVRELVLMLTRALDEVSR